MAVWAVPFGLVVAGSTTSPPTADRYFGAGDSPWEILYVWQGRPRHLGGGRPGRGRRHRRLQAHGIRSCPPWTLWRPACSSPRRSGAGATGSTRSCSAGRPTCRGASRSTRSTTRPGATATSTTFHPTFLYESLWCLLAFAVRGLGRPALPARPRPDARALRHALHARPRLDRELRIDPVEAGRRVGLRLNVWTSIVLFVLAPASVRLQPSSVAGPEREDYAPRPDGLRPAAGSRRAGRGERGAHDKFATRRNGEHGAGPL